MKIITRIDRISRGLYEELVEEYINDAHTLEDAQTIALEDNDRNPLTWAHTRYASYGFSEAHNDARWYRIKDITK